MASRLVTCRATALRGRRLCIVAIMLGALGALHGAARADDPAFPAAGPTYYLLPLHGQIGREVNSEYLTRALADVERRKPNILILEINSPGGDVAEQQAITDEIVQWQTQQKIRTVALVRSRAFDSAVVVAVSCREIFVLPNSAIGAMGQATNTKAGVTGGNNDEDLALLRNSENQARQRATAEFAGHNPLLIAAMYDKDIQLWVKKDAKGKPVVIAGDPKRRRQPGPPEPGAVMLVDFGKLLTLTPQEAVDCGLAAGVVRDVPELLTRVGLLGAQESSPFARELSQRTVAKVTTVEAEYVKLKAVVDKALATRTRSSEALNDLRERRGELNSAKSSLIRIEQLAKANAWLNRRLVTDYRKGNTKDTGYAVLGDLAGKIKEQLNTVEQQVRRAQEQRDASKRRPMIMGGTGTTN